MEQKLPEPIKTNWLNALRSGEYQQGEGSLQPTYDTFCCIGVFCIANNIKIHPSGNDMVDENGESCGYKNLNDLVGISTTNQLWEMNDVKKFSFNQIADWIEENL
jgi:hypothetical protein